MNVKPVFPLLITAFLLTGCTSMKVQTELAGDYDFATAKTFTWIPGPAEILNQEDTYINKDIELALGKELGMAGIREVRESDNPDIHMAYYVKLKEELQYTDAGPQTDREFSGGFVYERDSGSWSYQEREPDLNVYAVEIGTLTVLAYDAGTGRRIWRGTLRTKLDRSRPEEEQQALIDTVAEKLMGRFPSIQD